MKKQAETPKEGKGITEEEFNAYMAAKGYENPKFTVCGNQGCQAYLQTNTRPNKAHFSQVSKLAEGLFFVRLFPQDYSLVTC